MLNHPNYTKSLFIALCGLLSTAVYAEISLIDQQGLISADDHLKLTSKGSLRLQALNFDRYNDSNQGMKYRRDGYSATSRLFFNADYQFTDDLHLIAKYATFINPPKMLDWEGHYRQGESSADTQELFAGIQSQQYGSLKFGKMYSIYYDVVGSKTDLWDYNTLGQPQTWSPVSHFDGTQASSKTLRYEKKSEHIDFYAAYLFKDQTNTQDMQYQRKSGQELAVDIHLSPNLSVATAWKHNRASLNDQDHQHDFKQQSIASSLFYFNGHWMLGLGAGWYKNLLPNSKLSDQPQQKLAHYLNTEAYGLEYYLGYHFKIEDHGINFVQPYIMGDTLKVTQGDDLYRRDYGLGVAVRFNHGIGFDYERLYTQDSFNTPDMHLFRLRYEW
ncbi:porin-like protein [Acinetobacter calcoaceticus]|uniref:Porin-like protein n=1 Tax=Acinetobacter calcoaceticus TaxID=471 RepID=A0A4V6NJC9_ACICA|nr:porin-like protein [Acinetobacter calcoaceticus]